MKKNVLCLGLLMTGVLACFQIEAQTITAPVGTPLTITNPVDVTTGYVKISTGNSYQIGSVNALTVQGSSVFVGDKPVASTGANNAFIGSSAGVSNTTGAGNLFLGPVSGYTNTVGNDNVFMGNFAGAFNTSGSVNVFLGSQAGRNNSTGEHNLFLGGLSGIGNLTGGYNVFLGGNAGGANTTGSNNVYLGENAGVGSVSGANNTYIGVNSGSGASSLTNAAAIGFGSLVTTSNTVVLGNAATVVIGASAASATPAKLEVTGTTAAKSGVKFTSLATGALTGALNNLRTGGFLTVDNTGEIVWAATGASRLGNPEGITSAEGTATFSDNNWSLANGYLKNTSKRGVVIGEGITTMPEGYSFYVADGILTEKVKVAIKGTDEWADYVFGKNYNRMSLTDVAKYIEKNKHLPNVPSAAEMVQNGNDLHKTDVKLLEKIEELTLYMIEMKKENEQLKKDVDSLKKRRK